MTRLKIFALLCTTLATPLAWHNPAFADPPPNYDFVSYDEGLRRAAKAGKPIFLYFGRYGCAWCDWTNRETFSNADLRKLYGEHYVLVYVDAESGKRLTLPSGERITEAELGTRFRAFATPLFVYLDAGGKQIFKAPGFKTVDDFKDFDRYVSGGHYKNQKLMEFLGSGK
jgi:thioredoxin-related protein